METTTLEEMRFGVIADIQYADADDILLQGNHRIDARKRFYRNTVNHLAAAIKEWNSIGVEFILQLGDIIDGKNKHTPKESLDLVLQYFSFSNAKHIYHSIGNHELYNFSHKDVVQCLVGQEKAYYSFCPRPAFRFICLDCYDIAVIGHSSDTVEYAEATKILYMNPNRDQNSPTGLPIGSQHILKYNGAVGAQQLEWLEKELEDADKLRQQVIVFGHVSVLPAVSTPQGLVWNYERVLHLLETHICVSLYLAGHRHKYASAQSPAGVTHMTLPGVIETPPGGKCWANVLTNKNGEIEITVYDDDSVHTVQVEPRKTIL